MKNDKFNRNLYLDPELKIQISHKNEIIRESRQKHHESSNF